MDHFELFPHQKDVIQHLGSGKVLHGDVGSGKGIAALYWYIQNESPSDILVITTAKKRDFLEWDSDAALLGIGMTPESTLHGIITIDSWNNISKYEDFDGFVIFDEQRVVGNGQWVKSFIKIARRNKWILLSATPGDTWMDYAPIFIANGFYKNITEFKNRHVVYAPYVRFPKIVRYNDVELLEELRNEVLVEMPFERHTTRNINWLDCGFDKGKVNEVLKTRVNVFTGEPLLDMGDVIRCVRKVVNMDPSRLEIVRYLMQTHDKLIIFYNFDYELEILRGLKEWTNVAEWNGHRHQHIPKEDRWVYLVQYQAGAEGWNCVDTSAMIMYSLTYSYKNFMQAQGRIDRLDTPFTDLYYYVLVSDSLIDKMIKRALTRKKSFNERSIWSKL